MSYSHKRSLTSFLLLAAALLCPLVQSTAHAYTTQVELVDFEPVSERVTESDSVTLEGLIVLPEGSSAMEVFQVTAHLGWRINPKNQYSTVTDGAGHFRITMPRSLRRVTFRADSEHYIATRSGQYDLNNPKEIRLRVRAKQAFHIRCQLEDGQPVAKARFVLLGFNLALPGESDAKGRHQAHIGSAFRGGFLLGVSSDGLLAGPIPIKDDGPHSLVATFMQPARVRIPFAKKYAYATGALVANIQNWPKSDWPDGFQVTPNFRLAPNDPSPTNGTMEWADGIQEFLVPPGHAWHFNFALDPDWYAKTSVPALRPGQLYQTPQVLLDPGPVVRGRVLDQENSPVANATVRGLSGWNPPIDGIHYDGSVFLYGSLDGDSNRESAARKRAHRETTTDHEGRFFLPTAARILSVPLEISVPTGPNSIHASHEVRQFFPKVSSSGEEQILVLAPAPQTLDGLVLDSNGAPVSDFTIEVESQGHALELQYSQLFNPKENSKDWYQVIAPERRGDMFMGDSDGSLLGPPYSPSTRFKFGGTHGKFHIGVLPKGKYQLTVITADSHSQTWEEVALPRTEPLTLQLKTSASLAVRVLSGDKLPIAGLNLQLKGPLTSHEGSSYVSNAGTRYGASSQDRASLFGTLAPGRYELSSPKQGDHDLTTKLIQIPQGSQLKYDWTANSLGTLSGRIDWPSDPLTVQATLAWKGSVPPGEVARPRGRTFSVAGEPFRMEGLHPGSYTLGFKLKSAGDRIDHILPSHEIHVKAGDVTELLIHPPFDLQVIHGTVQVNGVLASEGKLLVEVPNEGRWARRFFVGKDGTFLIPVLGTDSIRLHYSRRVPPDMKRHETVGAQLVHFETADQSQLDLHFTNNDVEIWFVDDAGSPMEMSDAMVTAFHLQSASTPKLITYSRTATRTGDHLLFPAVPPGEYVLAKQRKNKHFPWGPDPKLRIHVPSNSPVKETITLEPRYKLQGKVVCADWPLDVPIEVSAWADANATIFIASCDHRTPTRSKFTLPFLRDPPLWLTVNESSNFRRDRSAAKTAPQGPFDPKALADSPIQLTIQWPGNPEPRPPIDPRWFQKPYSK
ncbi:MAG: hypothetical protein ACI87O_001932 [Planctomycetota bacterium]|jgi:hypothetical protein